MLTPSLLSRLSRQVRHIKGWFDFSKKKKKRKVSSSRVKREKGGLSREPEIILMGPYFSLFLLFISVEKMVDL